MEGPQCIQMYIWICVDDYSGTQRGIGYKIYGAPQLRDTGESTVVLFNPRLCYPVLIVLSDTS